MGSDRFWLHIKLVRGGPSESVGKKRFRVGIAGVLGSYDECFGGA